MIDRLFSAVLTFCLLAAGTLAIGSQMFGHAHRATTVATAAEIRVIQLPTVVITGQRDRTAVAEADASQPAVE